MTTVEMERSERRYGMSGEAYERAQPALRDAAVTPDGELLRLWLTEDDGWFMTIGDGVVTERIDIELGVFVPRMFSNIRCMTRAERHAQASPKRGYSIRATVTA